MVIALLALGLVMILGGVAAVVQGFPYVRLESGLAMVIAGTTAASAGVVTLGLAGVVLWLKRIESAFAFARHANSGASSDVDAVPAADSVGVPAGTAAALGGATFGDLMAREPAEPIAAHAPTIEPTDRIGAPAGVAEPWLPEPHPRAEPANLSPTLVEARHETAAESGNAAALAAERPEEPSGYEVEMTLRPSLDADAAGDATPVTGDGVEATPPPAQELSGSPKATGNTEPAAAAEAPPAAADQRQAGAELEVIGTYSSGGNTYVMFADGTIEAETPRGRFNFNSLDELKDFVDSGGEQTRGAA